MLKTVTFPLDVTNHSAMRCAVEISDHIDGQRKQGFRFKAAVPVPYPKRSREYPKGAVVIMMIYEGYEGPRDATPTR